MLGSSDLFVYWLSWRFWLGDLHHTRLHHLQLRGRDVVDDRNLLLLSVGDG